MHQPYVKSETFLLALHAGDAVNDATHSSMLLWAISALRILARRTKRTGTCSNCESVCPSNHHLSGLSHSPLASQKSARKTMQRPETIAPAHPLKIITALRNAMAAGGSRRTTSTNKSSLRSPLAAKKREESIATLAFSKPCQSFCAAGSFTTLVDEVVEAVISI